MQMMFCPFLPRCRRVEYWTVFQQRLLKIARFLEWIIELCIKLFLSRKNRMLSGYNWTKNVLTFDIKCTICKLSLNKMKITYSAKS